MKINFQIIPLILFVATTHLAMVGQTKKQTTKAFFPLKSGNYWVYSQSDVPDKLDTVKIIETKIVNDTDTGYYYAGNLWVAKADSIFQYQSHRGGTEYRTLQYFPSKKTMRYKVVVQGDILAERSVSKLKKPYVVKGKKYFNCYKFTDHISDGNNITIISAGIGIIESKSAGRTISLVAYKTQ